MLIKDIFQALQYGELSQLHLNRDAQGELTEAVQLKLLSHIQLGLTALHRRFKIQEKEHTVLLVVGTRTYALPTDCLNVLKVSTGEGQEVYLNVEDSPYSVYTPNKRTLSLTRELADQGEDLPDELKTSSLVLKYKANHDTIDSENFDIDSTEVDLPEAYLDALLYYVAARAHNPIGTMTSGAEGQVGTNWSNKYEVECRKLENEGIPDTPSFAESRMARGGWV